MAEVISSGSVVQKPDTIIDPRFPFPPGVIDVRQATREEAGFGDEAGSGESVYGEGPPSTPFDPVDVPPLYTPGGPVGLPAPPYFEIVEQRLRTNADGVQVVDVYVEIEEVDVAPDYEARVTPV